VVVWKAVLAHGGDKAHREGTADGNDRVRRRSLSVRMDGHAAVARLVGGVRGGASRDRRERRRQTEPLRGGRQPERSTKIEAASRTVLTDRAAPAEPIWSLLRLSLAGGRRSRGACTLAISSNLDCGLISGKFGGLFVKWSGLGRSGPLACSIERPGKSRDVDSVIGFGIGQESQGKDMSPIACQGDAEDGAGATATDAAGEAAQVPPEVRPGVPG
jgi:hypothetical protein